MTECRQWWYLDNNVAFIYLNYANITTSDTLSCRHSTKILYTKDCCHSSYFKLRKTQQCTVHYLSWVEKDSGNERLFCGMYSFVLGRLERYYIKLIIQRSCVCVLLFLLGLSLQCELAYFLLGWDQVKCSMKCFHRSSHRFRSRPFQTVQPLWTDYFPDNRTEGFKSSEFRKESMFRSPQTSGLLSA
jgi:hypothetical protein